MTAPQPSLLVLDVGTTSVRAALFRDGALAAHARRTIGMAFPGPGRAEQDPREIWEASRAVLEEASARLGGGEPAALGITNQRSTLVAWDAETELPLGPALSWRDSRAVDEARSLAEAVPGIPTRTGLLASAHYGAPKIAWILAAWPEAAAAAARGRLRVGPVGTWVAHRLSRGTAFTVDPTNAQRMLLMDLARLEWDEALVSACGVPASALPGLLPTDGYFGEAHVSGRVIPIRAMLGDQQAALLGLSSGAQREGSAGVQLGTGGFVLKDVGETCRHVPGLLSGLARADANRPRRYLVEGTVNAAGSALDRLRDLGALRDGDDVDELCDGAARPATVVPAWAGLGSPWWEAGARGAVVGLEEASTRADVVAGAVLGIAFLVADVVDAMSAGGLEITRLDASGPLSRLRSVAAALADATGRPVHVRTNPEASLEGIAVALADACGGVPPALSVEHGRLVEPARDLSRARRDFGEAREAVVRLARDART